MEYIHHRSNKSSLLQQLLNFFFNQMILFRLYSHHPDHSVNQVEVVNRIRVKPRRVFASHTETDKVEIWIPHLKGEELFKS